MRNKQHKNNETLEVTKKIQTGLSIRKNEISIKKRRDRPRHKSKKIRIKIIVSNTYEIRRTTIYKRLPRRLALQEMNTIKQFSMWNLSILSIKEERTKTSDRLQETQRNHHYRFDTVTSYK